MPYTHTTFAALTTELAGRLADPSRVFWVTEELHLYIRESLRTFGLLSGFWRERASLTLHPDVDFYDLQDLQTSTGATYLTPTVTDWDLIKQIQYHLLENASSQSQWLGTEMFTFADIANAITRYRDQFLADTGILIHQSTEPIASPYVGRQVLSPRIVDVRRAAWIGASPYSYYTLLWREDERAATLANPLWTVSIGTPEAFSVLAPPPLQLQLIPPPEHSGRIELLTVQTGVDTIPSAGPARLNIPDDLTPGVKWGALGYLLSIDGQARDPVRAQYCGIRYQQYVKLARLMSAVIHSEINGLPVVADTLFDLDTGMPGWQQERGEPTAIGLAGWNLAAFAPVPDNLYSATFDLVRMTPVPSLDTDYVQIAEEQRDAILDYAVHLALFKAHGTEFAATEILAEQFLLQAVNYNQRLGASARYLIRPKESSQHEQSQRPRRVPQASGVGAFTTPPEMGSE